MVNSYVYRHSLYSLIKCYYEFFDIEYSEIVTVVIYIKMVSLLQIYIYIYIVTNYIQ